MSKPPDLDAAGLSSFETGVVLALAALKTSIAATPQFNREILEKAVQVFLDNPPADVDYDKFEWPLRVLLASQEEAAHNLLKAPPTPPTNKSSD